MSQNEYKSDAMEFSPAQLKASKVVSLVCVILTAIFYLLVILSVIKVDFWTVFLGALLSCFGVVLLLSGLIQLNTVSLFLSMPFLVPGVLALVCGLGASSYGVLYPLYIAIPALSSLTCALVCGGWRSHLKVIVAFGVEAMLYVASVLGWIPLTASVIVSVVWALAVVVYVVWRITRKAE